MIALAEILRGLAGATRIIRFDASARDWYDDSLEAAKRSFWAALLGLPFDLLTRIVPSPTAPERGFDPVVDLLGYVIGWTAYPLAAFYLTRTLGVHGRYPRYLAAYNWLGVVQLALFAPLLALIRLSGDTGDATAIVGLGIMALSGAYLFFTARIFLAVPPHQAFGLVVVDYGLTISLSNMVDAMKG